MEDIEKIDREINLLSAKLSTALCVAKDSKD